jgi:hypothetical protein
MVPTFFCIFKTVFSLFSSVFFFCYFRFLALFTLYFLSTCSFFIVKESNSISYSRNSLEAKQKFKGEIISQTSLDLVKQVPFLSNIFFSFLTVGKKTSRFPLYFIYIYLYILFSKLYNGSQSCWSQKLFMVTLKQLKMSC